MVDWIPVGQLAGGARCRRNSHGRRRPVRASDHLDTPTVAMNPRADIGDLFAWTSSDAKQLNLVMTIVGDAFSDNVEYTFHIDSGKRLGATTGTTSIVCRFGADQAANCRADGVEPSRLRVFAGRRDDPFFNNVKRNAGGVSARRCSAAQRRRRSTQRAAQLRRNAPCRRSSPSGGTPKAVRQAICSRAGRLRRW